MRNLKKFLALVLAMMMTLSLMVTVNAKSFDDVDSTSTYAEAIAVLKGLGVVKGDENGKFNPKAPITRAEVAAMIYRLVTSDVTDSDVKLYENSGYFFTDVFDGKWYNGYVNYCANNGLVKGVGGNRFAPSADVTGYEALVMILRAIGYTNDDTFSGSDWKFKASGYARELGITDGIAEGTLGQPATREMVAQIMFKGLQAPMVRGNILGYTSIELVAATDANREHYKNYLTAGNTLPIYETLLRKSFNIVGKSNILYRDNYGRPFYQWAYDNANDKTVGTMSGAPAVNQGDANKYIVSASDTKTLKIAIDPVKTYYEKVTECQVSKDVNGDKTLTDVSEWVNGGQVAYSFWNTAKTGGAGNDYRFTRTLDALHTTTDTIGAQGRTTEVYKVPGGWNIVYVDTLMGVVTGVTKRTFDTNGHVYHPATLDVLVNDAVTVTDSQTSADYTYTVGDEVLLTTYGFNDTVFDTAAAKAYILEQERDSSGAYDAADTDHVPVIGIVSGDFAIPDKTGGNTESLANNVPDTHDFKVSTVVNGAAVETAWAVDVVGAPTTQQITVKATVGDATDKTGLVGTDGNTYPASNVYHAEAGPVGNPYATQQGTYVPDDYSINMTNNLINRTFTLYRDPRGNIVGMTEGSTNNIGVITELEPVRVGTGKWVMEMEIFHSDNTSETLRFVTWDDDGGYDADGDGTGDGTWVYVASNATAVDEKGGTTTTGNVEWNKLIKYEPVTLDGQTYYGVVEVATPDEDITTNATTGVMVQTGVADTLRGNIAATSGIVLDNTSKFILGSTVFDYSVVNGQNTGAQVLGGLKGYTGFKTIPTIMGQTGDVMIQTIDDTYYVYPEVDANRVSQAEAYGYAAQPTITVDESYLVLATVATYQDHATYRVIRNGEVGTLDVANINDGAGGLNSLVETAMNNNELIRVQSKDLNGYATSITYVEQDYNLGRCDDASGALAALNVNFLDQSKIDGTKRSATIPANFGGGKPITVTLADGVLTLGGGAAVGIGADYYLTVADTCKVQIVNLATGNVYDGDLESVNQYRKTTTNGDANISELVYEIDANGYVCNIYIID